MTGTPLPLEAETADELLVAYVNGSLGEAERQAVERWLGENPVWNARLAAYRAISAGVRTTAAAAPPPAALTSLWQAVEADSSRRGRSAPPTVLDAPPPAPGAGPPPPLTFAPRARPRRPATGWLFAAAAVALLAVAAGAVVALRDSGGSGDVTASPETAATAASAEDDDDMMAALVSGADATSAAGTANVVMRADMTVDVRDTSLADRYDTDYVTYQFGGVGQVEMPGRSLLETAMVAMAGDEQLSEPSAATVVEDDGRRWVRCAGAADFVDTTVTDAPCLALPIASTLFGPDAIVGMLHGNRTITAVTDLGTDTIGGVEATGYQLTTTASVEGEVVPVTVQVWVDGESLIRRVVGVVDYDARLGTDRGEGMAAPTRVTVSYDLAELGMPVSIPDMD